MPGHKLKRRLDRKSKARSPKPHPASAPARAPEPMGDLSRIRELTPNAVVHLQSMIGNQAVQRLLHNGHPRLAITPRQPASVQRWEGPEHAKLGNATGMTIDLAKVWCLIGARWWQSRATKLARWKNFRKP